MPGATPRGYAYPLYSDVQDAPAQVQALAEDIDADVQGLYDAADGARNAPSGTAEFGGVLLVASGVTTPVPFDTELYDNANMIDIAGAPTDISIPEVGVYVVSAWISWQTAASGAVALLVRSTGGFIPDVVSATKAVGLGEQRVSAIAVTRCTSTAENITISVLQNTGSPLNLTVARMTVTKVAP